MENEVAMTGYVGVALSLSLSLSRSSLSLSLSLSLSHSRWSCARSPAITCSHLLSLALSCCLLLSLALSCCLLLSLALPCSPLLSLAHPQNRIAGDGRLHGVSFKNKVRAIQKRKTKIMVDQQKRKFITHHRRWTKNLNQVLYIHIYTDIYKNTYIHIYTKIHLYLYICM